MQEQQLLKRLTSLEDEMVKLKPVLLLDPFPATASESSLSHASAYLASLPYPAASGKEAVRAQRSRRKKLEAKHKDIDPLDQELDHVAASSAPNDSPNSTGLGAQGTSSRNPKDLDGKISQSYIPDQLQDDSNVLPSKSVRSEKHVSRRTEPPGTLLLWPAHIQPPATPPSLLETPSAILDAPSAPGLNERSENAAFDSAIEPPLASSLSKPARPLTSDARMEHLLLAARMIGRKRAAFAAGIMDAELEKEQKERKEKEKEWREKEKEKKQREREREKKEREIVEKSKSERSKEKTSSTATLRSSAGGSRSLKGKSKGKEKALPKSSGIGKSNSLKRTPSRSGRELEGMLDDEVIVGSSKQRRTKQTRPKPRALSASSSAGSTQKTLSGMDSLLSAARSMMDHGSNQFTTRDKANKGGIDIDSTAGSRRPASELGGYEDTDMLPPAKRQKSLVVSSNRPMRTPSALDVLADQAAAAVSTSAASSDMDSTILEGKIVKNDLEDSEDAEGEYEDDPADSNSVTRLNSPTTNTDGPRRNSRRSASSRSVINTRVISSAKSPTKGLS
ncbi:hypothetical protein GG344DRAFT_80604 [Lentinula edodes]|nr:hypothetical protein GG344DRAFT_80604 [Lentinula edodes]